jgi:hypothetical protein
MPLLIAPAVRTIDSKRNHHATSFTFDWDNEPISNMSIGGLLVTGAALFTLQTHGIGGVASLPPVRSLRFSQSFFNADTPDGNDGSLFIVFPASGEMTRISPLLTVPGTFTRVFPTVTGVIPVVSAIDAPIQFFRQAVVSAGTAIDVVGFMTITLYDFDVPPFIQSGFSNQP